MSKRSYGIPCHICKFAKGEIYEKLVDGKLVHQHLKCPTCSYCHETISKYDGSIVTKHMLSGTYEHKTCPMCQKCGLPASSDDKMDIEWVVGQIVHQKCRTCLICNQGSGVELYGIEEAENIPYAHPKCLSTIYCKVHKCYLPCKVDN